jgi:hypothetical protein
MGLERTNNVRREFMNNFQFCLGRRLTLMRSVIGCAVPCGPRSMKNEEEEKVIEVACEERTIFAYFARR